MSTHEGIGLIFIGLGAVLLGLSVHLRSGIGAFIGALAVGYGAAYLGWATPPLA